MSKSKEVLDIKDVLAKAAAETTSNERPDVGYISLRSGVMTYMEEPLTDNRLECVVIANSHERTFYDRPFDPDDVAPPECFAQALESSELVAHENVPNPISTEGCKTCPNAEFGTAKVGKGPACKTHRKLVVLPVSALNNPDSIGKEGLAVLKVSPTSVKNFSQYINKVASTSGLPPWGVKTMITVKPHPKKQFEVTFQTTGPVGDEAALMAIHSRIHEAEQILLTPFSYEEEEEAPAKKSKKY